MPPEEDNRPDFLKNLDSFNTAEEFGLPGLLKEEQAAERQQQQPDEKQEREPREPKDRDDSHEKIYAPLNTSIQELGHRMDSRYADIERTIDQKLQQTQALRQEAQRSESAPSWLQNADPDMPVSMAQLAAMHNEYQANYGNVARQSQESAIRAENLRAHLEFERFASVNPDIRKMTNPQDIDRAFNQYIGNDVNRAKSVNWTGHFAQLYQTQAQPKQAARIAELEKEIESLKKRPAQSEQRMSPATSGSPSVTARSGAIESVTNRGAGNTDVTHLASYAKGKSFKSYASDIKRMYGITNS